MTKKLHLAEVDFYSLEYIKEVDHNLTSLELLERFIKKRMQNPNEASYDESA